MKFVKVFAFMVAVMFFAIPATAAEKRFTVPLADSPSTGPENAPVTIIEFLDFQ